MGEISANAKLPEDLEEKPLRGMLVGETGWCVPWAVEVDSKRRLWLRATFTGEDEPGGTVSMFVRREAEGFVVDISRTMEHKWDTSCAVDANAIDEQDPDNPEWLPVIELIR